MSGAAFQTSGAASDRISPLVYSRQSPGVGLKTSLEFVQLTIRSVFALRVQLPARKLFRSKQAFAGRVLLALLGVAVMAGLAGCGQDIYRTAATNFAGRPTPPSGLQQRVLAGLSVNGAQGGLQILDGLRDLRNNVQNTVPGFPISGFSGAYPSQILSYPEQLRGYVYSNASPYTLSIIDYSKEASGGAAATFNTPANGISIPSDFVRIYATLEQNGQILVNDGTTGGQYALNLPNVYRIAANRGDTVALAMVRNSNALYRIIKLNQGTTAFPPGAVDCQPTLLPIYCVIPVPGTFDRPYDVLFSLDGSTSYVLNCGRECGPAILNNGVAPPGAGISFIPQGPLQIDQIPTALPYPAVVTNFVSVPGGVTVALSDGSTLYLAGQQQQADGLFAGRLSLMNLATLTVGTAIPISDGTHNKLIFADDNTLWIGSQFCATGERAKLNQNYNCLTRFDLGAQTATIVPANVVPGSTTAGQQVPYPNTDNNQYYYGSLTGICWVQNYHKVYTAYGGQIHAFNTVDGSEINNFNITLQGTVLDVAYMDALTNAAN